MRTRKNYIRSLADASMIGALYVALSLLSAMLGLASGVVQVRLSEALTVLAAFTPAAVPGLALGCLLTNLITGCPPIDVVFGALATLLGALGTYLLRRRGRWLAPLPPILSNTLIIPAVLRFAYHVADAYPILILTVFLGEVLSAGVLGMGVYRIVQKTRLFPPQKEKNA